MLTAPTFVDESTKDEITIGHPKRKAKTNLDAMSYQDWFELIELLGWLLGPKPEQWKQESAGLRLSSTEVAHHLTANLITLGLQITLDPSTYDPFASTHVCYRLTRSRQCHYPSYATEADCGRDVKGGEKMSHDLDSFAVGETHVQQAPEDDVFVTRTYSLMLHRKLAPTHT